MNERETVLEFEEDFLHLKPFSFAEIPDRWHEGDYIANLDGNEILNALNEAADYVEEEVFEDGPPGMSGTYYKVYAEDVESFRIELTNRLLLLLENTYGKNAKKGMKGKAKPMKNKKAKSKSNYPKELTSKMMSTGSRTVDSGHFLVVTVSDDGFSAYRDCGDFSTDDLFGELGYWPSEVTWTRKGPLLSELLRQLAKECGLGERKLRKIVNDHFIEYEDVDLNAYMTKELKRAKSTKSLAEFHRETPFELEHTQIPGIPSPEMGSKTFRNGLEISFHGSEWECELFSDGDGCGVELFNPQWWHADTFDELFQATDDYDSQITDYFDWDQAELAQLLIEDDPRWRPFVEPVIPEDLDVLTVRNAIQLVNQYECDELNFEFLTKLSDAAAEILSKYKGDLDLSGLTKLSNAAAVSLSKHEGALNLSGLTKLSVVAAESLCKHRKVRLDHSILTKLSDAVAENLSKHKGDLDLSGLTKLSDAAAERLSYLHPLKAARGGYATLAILDLNGLKTLTGPAAKSFSKFKGALYLNGLTTLSDIAAENLSMYSGDIKNPYARGKLHLRGLVTLSDAAAESLSKYKGALHLDGLVTLSDAAAESLSKHEEEEELFLSGLTTLSDASVKVLCNKRKIYLNDSIRGRFRQLHPRS